MPVVLTSTGIQFPDNITQTIASKTYTKQSWTSSTNSGSPTVTFTGIPQDAKNIVIAGSMSFSSGPNTPKVELMTDSTVHQGYYTGGIYANLNYMGSTSFGTLTRNGAFSNLFTYTPYSETPSFIIELVRTNATSNAEYVYTFCVNTNTSPTGNHIIGTGQIGTNSTAGFNKVVVGNGSSYNLVTADINVFYK